MLSSAEHQYLKTKSGQASSGGENKAIQCVTSHRKEPASCQLPERERPHLEGEYEANPFIPLSTGSTYEETR